MHKINRECSRLPSKRESRVHYATCVLYIWLSSNEKTDAFLKERAAVVEDVNTLMNEIIYMVEEGNPLKCVADLYSDMLETSLSEVDYYQIAEFYFDEYHTEVPME